MLCKLLQLPDGKHDRDSGKHRLSRKQDNGKCTVLCGVYMIVRECMEH